MVWQILPAQISSAQTVTLRNEGSLALSGEFLERNQLTSYEWAELFIDSSVNKIGFKFLEAETPNAVRLSTEGAKAKLIRNSRLKNVSFVKSRLNNPHSDKRFAVHCDSQVESPTTGVKYFIFLGFDYSEKRSLEVKGDFPDLNGVYRLYSNGELVRIGEGNIKNRLVTHVHNYGEEINEFDFANIEDAFARKKEEKKLLTEFENAYGRLPKLNSIKA